MGGMMPDNFTPGNAILRQIPLPMNGSSQSQSRDRPESRMQQIEILERGRAYQHFVCRGPSALSTNKYAKKMKHKVHFMAKSRACGLLPLFQFQ
jgi:hypothetical protein